MHMHLLEVEGQYNMLADAIESYKRRIIMLEESLPAHEDAGIYWLNASTDFYYSKYSSRKNHLILCWIN